MRILVTGSRTLEDKAQVYRTLSRLHHVKAFDELIHGGAAGADSFAHEWAEVNRVPIRVFRADWKRYGRAGGPKRNEEMAAAGPDLCVAFSGDNGTADMVKRAIKHDIPVMSMSDNESFVSPPGTVFRWHDTHDAEVIFVMLSSWSKTEARSNCVSVLILHSTYEYLVSGQIVTLRSKDQIWVNSTEFTVPLEALSPRSVG